MLVPYDTRTSLFTSHLQAFYHRTTLHRTAYYQIYSDYVICAICCSKFSSWSIIMYLSTYRFLSDLGYTKAPTIIALAHISQFHQPVVSHRMQFFP